MFRSLRAIQFSLQQFPSIRLAVGSNPAKLSTHSLLRLQKISFSINLKAGFASADAANIHEVLTEWSRLNEQGLILLETGTATDLTNAEQMFRQACGIIKPFKHKPNIPHYGLAMANLGSCLLRKNRGLDAVRIFREVLYEVQHKVGINATQVAKIHAELASALESTNEFQAAVRELMNAKARFLEASERYITLILLDAEGSGPVKAALLSAPAAASVDESTSSGEKVEEKSKRTKNILNALHMWRGAIGCQFRSAVSTHKQGDWEGSITHLETVLLDLKYMFDSISLIGSGTSEGTESIRRSPDGALSLSERILEYVRELDTESRQTLIQAVGSDLVQTYRSLADVRLQLNEVESACAAFESALEVQLEVDMDKLLGTIADAATTLRLLKEKLIDSLDTNAFKESSNISQTGGGAKARLDADRIKARTAVDAIDKCRYKLKDLFQKFAWRQKADRDADLKDGVRLPPALEALLSDAQRRVATEHLQAREAAVSANSSTIKK